MRAAAFTRAAVRGAALLADFLRCRSWPLWGATRFGYEYSQGLLDRLTPERRCILQPVAPARPPAGGAR